MSDPIVVKNWQQINWVNVPDLFRDGRDVQVTAGATSQQQCDFYYSSGPFSITKEGLLTPGTVVDTGSPDDGGCLLLVTQIGDDFWASTYKFYSFTNKKFQTISFSWPAVVPIGGVQLTATASSGLPVSYWMISGPGAVTPGGFFTPSESADTTPVVLGFSQGSDTEWAALWWGVTATSDGSGITVQDQQISFAWPTLPRTGGVQLTATASSGLSVTFHLVSGASLVTLGGWFVPNNEAGGDVTIEIRQAGNLFYNPVTFSATIRVKKFQTISFPRPQVLRWEATEALDEYGEYVFVQNRVDVEPWDLVWAGEETNQVIIGPIFPIHVVPLTLVATSDSLLTAFVYSVSLPAIAEVRGNVLTYKQAYAGLMTITATQPGDDDWWSSSASFTIGDGTNPLVSQEIRVSLASSIIPRGTTVEMVYGSYSTASPFPATGLPITVVSSNPECITVLPSSAGKCYLNAKSVGGASISLYQGGNATYGDAWLSISVECGRLPQTITFPQPPTTGLEKGDTVELEATSTSGLLVSYTVEKEEVATIIGTNSLLIKQIGLTKITATQAGDFTYREATPVVVTIAIGSSTQMIRLGAMPLKTYGDPPFVPEGNASSGLPITYTSNEPSVAYVVSGVIFIVGVGNVLITATQEGDAFWQPAAEASVMLRISRGAPALRVSVPSRLLIGGTGEVIAVASSGALVSLHVKENSTDFLLLDGTTVTGIAEGVGYIVAATEESELYLATLVSARIIVGRISQRITADLSFERTYSDREIRISASASSLLDVCFTNLTPEIADLVGDRVIFLKPGVSQIALTQEGDATYFPAAPKTIRIAVARGAQAISFHPLHPLLVGETRSLTATSPGGPVVFCSAAPEIASVQGSSVTAHRVGATALLATADLAGVSSNYLPPSVSVQPLVVVAARSDALPVGQGLKDDEDFSARAPSAAFTGAALSLPLPSITDPENLSFPPFTPASCADSVIEEAMVKDVDPFDPKIPSPDFLGTSFDMLGFDRGGDETPYLAAHGSVGWGGPSVNMPQATLGDGEGYVSTVESADTQAESVRAEFDGMGEIEEYISAAPRQPSGYLLCSNGGYILWDFIDDDRITTTGRFTL